MNAPKVSRPVRCAIYTRKSTEEGLEQEFNSLTPNASRPRPISPASSTRAGAACRSATTTAASPAATWNGRRCSACWPTSPPAR